MGAPQMFNFLPLVWMTAWHLNLMQSRQMRVRSAMLCEDLDLGVVRKVFVQITAFVLFRLTTAPHLFPNSCSSGLRASLPICMVSGTGRRIRRYTCGRVLQLVRKGSEWE